MSAFIVNPDHIDLLAAAIHDWAVNINTDANAFHGRTDYATMADLLWAANVQSVNYRYEDDQPAEPYTCRPLCLDRAAVAIRPEIMVLGAARCLRYQSCEHPEYRDSLAARILDAIEDAAIRRMTNVDHAPWEYTREWSEMRRRDARAKVRRTLSHAHA